MSCRSCPQAAEGPFYTIADHCLFCEAPHQVAPELLGWHQEPGPDGGKHCLVRRQPVTPEELENLLSAFAASCLENIRYRGRDPRILRLLRARGLRRICDHPLNGWTRLRLFRSASQES